MIDADPVAAAVRAMMVEQAIWIGTASELLAVISRAVDERTAKAKSWPESAPALSGRLRRAATFLRRIGIGISFDREGRGRTRIIRISTSSGQSLAEEGRARPSAPSASSTQDPSSISDNGLAASDPRTVASDADGIDKESGDRPHQALDSPSLSTGENCLGRLEGTDMSAAAAIRAARDAGVDIATDGNDLLLEASTPPPAELVDLVSRHKPRS